MGDIDQILAQLDELRRHNEALTARNDELSARLEVLEADSDGPTVDAPVSRRNLLAKAAVVAAGVVAGGALLSEPAAAYADVQLRNGETNSGPYQFGFAYSPTKTYTTSNGASIANGIAVLRVDAKSGLTPVGAVGLSIDASGTAIYATSYADGGVAVDASALGPNSIGGNFYGTDRGLTVDSGNWGAYINGANLGILATGRIPLQLGGGHGTAGTPTGITNVASFALDSNHDLYYCVQSGNPGLFRKVSGAGTAGSLHLLPQPVRVFDSRPGVPPLGGPKGVLAGGAPAVTIDCTANSSGVPADALGVSFNLTITGTANSGYLTTWGPGAQPGTSSINWSSGGLDIANGVTIACAPGAVIHAAAGGAGTTHFIVDVTGYYR